MRDAFLGRADAALLACGWTRHSNGSWSRPAVNDDLMASIKQANEIVGDLRKENEKMWRVLERIRIIISGGWDEAADMDWGTRDDETKLDEIARITARAALSRTQGDASHE